MEYVLLVDDDQTTNHVNKRLLMRTGMVKQVDVSQSGKEALDFLEKHTNEEGSKRLDLILLDLKMDGMDGFKFLEAYQQLPEHKKAHLLVALTSSASFYDLSRLQEYPDVTEHIFKPLTESHIQDLTARLQGRG